MKWTRGTRNADVVDVRGRSPRGSAGLKLGGGGLVVALLVFAVARFTGIDISGVLGGGGGGGGGGQPTSEPAPPSGPDPDAELVDFIHFVIKDIQDTFDAQYRAAGKPYRRAKLFIFREQIDTACGRSSSAIGPFYCPGDEQAYIDLSFYRELRQRFGAPGDFAQAYVLAHEIGHHLQTIEGVEKQARRLGGSRNEASVRQELQADCYAGVWGHAARGKQLLEAGDLEEALTAASAIGDDRLQQQAGVEVDPESFTHGTSEQRMRWFRRGFESGRLDACDTFSARDL